MGQRDSALTKFGPAARGWFQQAFAQPTQIQLQGWDAISRGENVLMCAPTGSGKTLAAFFWCLDQLSREAEPAATERCRVLYVSPLKALAVDVERNLRAPLRGMVLEAQRQGFEIPTLTAAIRSGDTPATERRQMERRPPDILITTPESLFLLLTSAARSSLASVRWVIVDEIHTMVAGKRGAHLALSLERLAHLTGRDPQRLGLSATVRPLDEAAAFLGGVGRRVTVIEAGQRKSLQVRVEVPVEDMADLARGAPPPTGSAAAIGAQEAPRRSMWPAIYPRLLEEIRAHRSTLIFANSRQAAERIAANINDLAGEPLVRAHHGSLAREERNLIEDALKEGRLPALVATSSLELGIDMGAIDLVVQVGSPGTVASALQRIGRAGHTVGATSHGLVLPRHRGDLLEAATLVERMGDGELEPSQAPRNPLDVLAQQIVAMCAMDNWSREELGGLVRRAYPFRDLGQRSLDSVLEMLSGRYPSDSFAGLRPRVVWDRDTDLLRGRTGAQRVAVTSGGTIPDRGLFTVNRLEDGRRVGELDEEMTYELRVGEVFVLGATSWRVTEITSSQVVVSPAPGEPGKQAFWKGDGVARPLVVGQAMGRLTRELLAMGPDLAATRLRDRAGLDHSAARNLLAYLDDQTQATGAVPDDATVVVERFRDQLGDWRVCVMTPLGSRVHAPWSLAIQARLRDRLETDVQVISSDDGFALRLPDQDQPPGAEDLLLLPEEVRERVMAQLHNAPVFAARFRENAARSLLLPRRRPGQRTPLWMQRQRSHDLLQVASEYPEFPILAETFRECLADIFDLPALETLMSDLQARRWRLVLADTERPSPFASSLVFDYVAQYLYDGDAPLAERRAQALTVDSGLLQELMGAGELQDLLDPQALAALELELQGLGESRRPRDRDQAWDLFRNLGDLSAEEARERGVEAEWLAGLTAERRLVEVRLGPGSRLVAVEDAASYRDALGVALPPGLPAALTEPVPGALEQLLLRFARTHLPFTAEEPAQRWGLSREETGRALDALVRRAALEQGRFTPSREGLEYGHPEVLRTLRRRTLASLRREVEPVAQPVLAEFLPRWQGVGSNLGGTERVLEVVDILAGYPLPMSVLESAILPVRVHGYQPALLDQLVAIGEVTWIGAGALGASDGRISLHRRSLAARWTGPARSPLPGPLQAQLRDHLARRSAFFPELRAQLPEEREADVLEALWDLVWNGEVTNDSLIPLRHLAPLRGGAVRRPGLAAAARRAGGRWSLVSDLSPGDVSGTEVQHARAMTLLRRHGVLTREAVLGEKLVGGFVGLYPVLRALEEAGRVRRGYFVEGMGGSQFALPGAVDALRQGREPGSSAVILNATDPGNAYGLALPWPEFGTQRLARLPSAWVVLRSGLLVAYLDRSAAALSLAQSVEPGEVRSLALLAMGSRRRLEIRSVNGRPIAESGIEDLLRAAGFESTPRGLAMWPRPAGDRGA